MVSLLLQAIFWPKLQPSTWERLAASYEYYLNKLTLRSFKDVVSL